MIWESTGVVNVVANSSTVVGVGTEFAQRCRIGDAFVGPDGSMYEVIDISSDTLLTVKPNYTGTSASAQPYRVVPINGYAKKAADYLHTLLREVGPTLEGLVNIPSWVFSGLAMPLEDGGTGARDAASARQNLSVHSKVEDSAALNLKVDKVSGHALLPLTEAIRLQGMASHATKNSTDAALRDRSSHTGTQPLSTIPEAVAELALKVDKVPGKVLSSANFTQAEKDKLAALESSKYKGVFGSLGSLRASVLNPQAGDFADVDSAGVDAVRYLWDATDAKWVSLISSVGLNAAQVKDLYENNPDTNVFSDDDKTKLAESITGTDARLTDSREWSTETVPQLEAEVGTSSTRRAWTAERVKQAFDAFLERSSSVFGRVLLNRTSAAQVRDDLELSPLATMEVGTGAGTVAAGDDSRILAALTSSTIVQELGDATDKVVSQKTLTTALSSISSTDFGTDDYQGPYGISYNESTDSYIRLGAAGFTSIQSGMKRCILNPDGTVKYFLHPDNSNFKEDGTASDLTGFDGNVMVQIPKFYYKVSKVGPIVQYMISKTGGDGYTLHPTFIKGGVEVEFRYFRAYHGIVRDGRLQSVSGVLPSRTSLLSEFRVFAEANGPGWHQTDWGLLNAVQILFVVEFCTFDSQRATGFGNSNSEENKITGLSDSLGNHSTTTSVGYQSYRGIESLYGHNWEMIDGFALVNTQPYVNFNYLTYANDILGGDYTPTGSIAPSATGYVSKMDHSELGIFTTETLGDSSSFYADICFCGTEYGEGIFLLAHGGGRTNNWAGGLFHYNYSGLIDVRKFDAAGVAF